MTAKIQIISDVHTEFNPPTFPEISQEADVIVFAGDIATTPTKAEAYLESVRKQTTAPIVYVLGNHEYYSTAFEDTANQYKEACRAIKHLYLLDDSSITLDGVQFFGTTLWTDYDNQRCSVLSLNVMADFRYMKTVRQERVSIDDIVKRHERNKLQLQSKLYHTRPNKTVVITHHGPSFSCVDPAYARSNLNGAFFVDMDKVILEFQPNLWIYGHTHRGSTHQIGSTKLCVNPWGYPNESKEAYTEKLLVEI